MNKILEFLGIREKSQKLLKKSLKIQRDMPWIETITSKKIPKEETQKFLDCLQDIKKQFWHEIQFGDLTDKGSIHKISGISMERLVEHFSSTICRTSPDGVPYAIHEVPENEKMLLGSVIQVKAPKYWKVLIQLNSEYLLSLVFGELCPGEVTEILKPLDRP